MMGNSPLERFAALVASMNKSRRKGRSLSAFETLNDHTLRDIGIHRCQIPGLGMQANDNGSSDLRQTG